MSAYGATVSEHKYIDVARSLVPLLTANVAASAELGNLVPEAVDALFDSGLFWMLVPQSLGGAEVDAMTAFEIIEMFSYLDGSTGWTFMAGAHQIGQLGAFLHDDAVAQIFADPRAMTAGQVAPRGVCEAVAGGYRVSGEFGFSSGSNHSNWIIGGFREMRDGKPVRLENGLPNVIVAVVPADQVDFRTDWNVIGLTATGSVDYQIPEQFVAEAFAWPLFTSGPRRGGDIYRLGVNGLTCIDHAAFSIGVGRRTLDEIAQLAVGRRRAGRVRMIDDPTFLNEYARAEAKLSSARAYFLSVLRSLEAAAEKDAVTIQLRGAARLATSNASHCAMEVASFAQRFSGGTGLRNGSAIQRGFRDLTASEAHVFTDPSTWSDAALAVLDNAPPTLFI